MTTISTDEVTNLLDEASEAFKAAALTVTRAADGVLVPLTVIKGFPRHQALSLPTLSIEAGTVTRRQMAPEVMAVEPIPGSDPAMVKVTWVAQRVSVVVNIDLWTADATQRYVLRPALEAVFRPDMDEPPGLMLTLENSHKTVARMIWLDDRALDAEGDEDGIRRLAITARADFSRLVVETRPAAAFNKTLEYQEQ